MKQINTFFFLNGSFYILLWVKKGVGKIWIELLNHTLQFLIRNKQDAWCCLTTTIALFVYFSVPWLHLIYYIKKTNLRTVMNLFWRSWNKLHVIFYILALRQVLINLCEKTQYLHNREFFFQKEKLFKIIRFWISRQIAALFFVLFLKDWNALLCTSLIQPLKKRFFPKTCVTKTKYSTYMKKIP